MTADPNNTLCREVIHHMGRRCFEWDYSSRCIYMITVELADRSKPVLGQLVGVGEEWRVEPSEIGRIVITERNTRGFPWTPISSKAF